MISLMFPLTFSLSGWTKMQLKIKWMAITFLAEHGDDNFQSSIFTRNHKILRLRRWKILRPWPRNFWGFLLGSMISFLAGAHIQGHPLITWLSQWFMLCTINYCQNHPSVACVPPVRKWCCFSVVPPAATQCVFVLEIWAWFSCTACSGL